MTDSRYPSALAVVADTLAAVIAPPVPTPRPGIVRDVELLQRECDRLQSHLVAADRAAAEMAETRRLIASANVPEPIGLKLSLPPELGRRLRAEAAGLDMAPIDLALEILAMVVRPGADSLIEAVLNRPR